MTNIKIESMDVILLCGGKGERLRPILADEPKPLAKINGRPFLDILIDYLKGLGFMRFILCTGYRGDLIKQHYKQKKESSEIMFSQETEPLGTAGAVKNAQRHIKSNPFLVMNGDSICKFDLNKFIDFHAAKKALITALLVKARKGQDYGVVNLDSVAQVLKFDEKRTAMPGEFINAGIYLLSLDVLALIPAGKAFSFEYDLFPQMVNRSFFGATSEARLIDIGTPERYEQAKLILK
jgi:NDP-sugar pyrophosphorylase family protein